jgi:hypothetical protein
MKNNNDRTIEQILNDKRAKYKAHQVFLKLLAKNKKQADPFGVVRSQTWNPTDKSNPRNEMEI